MAKNTYLTKTRFKTGVQCPTKLYYLDRLEFANKNKDNSFLEALAEGGFQVGALAKLYFPDGIEIKEIDKTKALSATNDILKNDSATIFEAAFSIGKLYLLADVIQKNKKSIKLIEVKAKSFDPIQHESFFTKKGTIKSEWEEYLLDIAFQKFVIQKCHDDYNVTASLMFVDKSKTATADAINQNFLISKSENSRPQVIAKDGLKKSDLGSELLIQVNVDAEIEYIWNQTYFDKYSFAELVSHLENIIINSTKANPAVGQHCKNCEFRCSDAESKGLKNGFYECWSSQVKNPIELASRTPIFDIWNFRKAEKLISQGILFVDQLNEEDIAPSEKANEVGLSQSQRQWLQVEKDNNHDNTPYFDHEGIQQEISSWTYPIHCIDFETSMVALPFNKGRKPYEQIAFQFSHHAINADGSIEHKTQYINREKGKFPNFDFLRHLKNALNNDNGTILRFAAHENTVLCQIRQQILDLKEPLADARELVSFIETITSGPDEKWIGRRNMVDLCELVKKFYYHPYTKGSNSIKKVLPAILNESKFLKLKYGQPIYGSVSGIKSLNYKEQTWIEVGTDGKVKDPYKILPPIFQDFEFEEIESILGSNSLADGGAAMTAYARMQFSEMSQIESDRIATALLKYCELDTFAMVMIVEYWQNEIVKAKLKVA